MNVIETHKLTKYYGKSRGIIDVTLAVEEGDFFGFIGPNGAGKSTTIRTLLGLISPTGGKAEIFGLDAQRNKVAILSDVGYLPGEAAFYSGMRVKDILNLSAKLHKKDCQREADILCQRMQLDTQKKVETLSLGNRKKVGIVCALQHRPNLYVLDEPTSGLDPLMQREFYMILQERNEEGATIFLSSHVLSEVQRYCKHAGVIREGKLLVTDRVESLGHTGTKRVSLRGITELPRLDGVKDVKQTGDTWSFLFGGKSAELLGALSKLPIEDVNIFEPDLEEVFMHY